TNSLTIDTDEPFIKLFEKNPQLDEQLLNLMKERKIQMDDITITSLLKVLEISKDIKRGIKIYEELKSSGIEMNIQLENSFINLFMKCGDFERVKLIFNEMKEKNVRTWSTMINGFIENGKNKEAIEYYNQMKQQGIKPDQV